MKVPLSPVRFLRYAQEQFPRKTAVVCDGQRFTYAELGERAGRLAGALRLHGVQPGSRVAYLSANCHRLLEAYYGVLEAGCVFLPLNIRLAAPELAWILNDARAEILFVQQQFLSTAEFLHHSVPSIRTFVLLDERPQYDWLAPHNYEDLLEVCTDFRRDVMEFDEDSIAELFYTSGTSAQPKGVMLTHRNIYLHGLHVALANQTNKDSVELHTIPLFHANGWGLVHTVTVAGGTHVLVHRFNPVEVFQLIERERVSECYLVPTMASALVNSPERSKYDLRSLQRVIIGGAASSPTLIKEIEEKLGCICYSGYGLTETSPALSVSSIKPGTHWAGEKRYARQAMAGFAIPGVEIRVVDPLGRDVRNDGKSIGEIVVRGDGVMEGYWANPEATATAFTGGWFHTGDLATIDEDGYVLIVDRKKDIIVSGGENISSLEVEKKLAEHPSVYEAAVIPVADKKWGEVPKALVVLKPGSKTTENELLEFCRSTLAHYKCPQSVEFVDDLPKSGTGKVLKRALREKYRAAYSA